MFASGKTAAVASAANYIEDVFSTYLYTGTGASQTITNGIDLSTKGGLVWVKVRSSAFDNNVFDTSRGANNFLVTNTDAAADSSETDRLTAFNANGFSLGVDARVNASASTYVSWTWRKQPKFFDIQTWTGTGSARTVAHNLGSVPGCIIVKRTDSADGWRVYHRANTAAPETDYLVLNDTAATVDNNTIWNDTLPTSTVFTVGTGTTVNENGGTYVAYLFAHDAGGFGLTGSDNVISCGTFTGNSAGDPVAVNLGYEAQWVMHKRTNGTGNWAIFDSMRGAPTDQPSQDLLANSSAAEVAGYKGGYPTSTGFVAYPEGTGSPNTYIYIAIRRGPMKVPTSGTSVFGPNATSGTGANTIVTGGQTDDAVIIRNRGATIGDLFASRLTGTGYLDTTSTAAEVAAGTTILQDNPWDVMDGVKVGTTSTITNASSNTFINYLFKRAPSFFDVVCYTGTGSNTTVSHNLTVIPEMIIVKNRSAVGDWRVYTATGGNTNGLKLNGGAGYDNDSTLWNSTSPTSSVFSIGTNSNVNTSGNNYVAYLFATCAGVSKVGSYTGTGTTIQVDCGFTSGARFVMIKRADGTGSWYVWDTARGIVSGNDPYLRFNSTDPEVTNADLLDPYSAGFEVSTGVSVLNGSGNPYIFLAIA